VDRDEPMDRTDMTSTTRRSSAPEIERGARPAAESEPASVEDLSVERGAARFDPATTTSDEPGAMVVPEAVEGGALEIEDLTSDVAGPDRPDA
jgi:hypothetical protein